MPVRKKKPIRRSKQETIDELPVHPVSEVDEFRSFVFYGRSNTGKTTLASTFPKPILLLDVRDRGTDSIADVKGIDVMRIGSFEGFEMAYWYLLKNNKKGYRTVVIDTMSQLQTIVVKETAADKNKSSSRAGDWGTMTKRDWGDVSALMKEWVINYRDLSIEADMDVVFIAQDRTFNFDEEADEEAEGMLVPEVGPALAPSVAKTLNAAVSVIGNTFIRTRVVTKEVRGKKRKREVIEHCLRVGPNPVYITKVRKSRSIIAPDVIVDPTYDDIMEIIHGE